MKPALSPLVLPLAGVLLGVLTHAAPAQAHALHVSPRYLLETLSDGQGRYAPTDPSRFYLRLTHTHAGRQPSSGSYSGVLGCNALSGRMVLNPQRRLINFGPMIFTETACPPEQRALEARAWKLLGAGTRYTLAGSRLTLRSGAVQAVFVLEAQPAARLQSTWQLEEGNQTLTLNDQGRVSGFAGCNAFSGGYTLVSGTSATPVNILGFTPLATTRKACPGPVMVLERRFLQQLAEVNGYMLEGQKLELVLDSGARLRFWASPGNPKTLP